jgi:hypothetical protein
MEALFKMELEVDTEDDLHDQHDHQDIRKRGVDIFREGSSLVHMSHEVRSDRNYRPKDL